MGVPELNRAKYSGADFNTHLDDILLHSQPKFEEDYNDYTITAQAIMLMDATAFGLDTLSFYQDRRATEVYLELARTRRSVAFLTRQLGYKMGAATAATADVRVALTKTYAFNITIPARFKFAGPNGLVYETSRDTVFLAGSGPTDFQFIPCYEGKTITESFRSDGTPNQVFTLSRVPTNFFVVRGQVTVTVDGTPYEEKDFLEFGLNQQFEVGYNDDPPAVHFGDGIFGTVPINNAAIVVTYVASSGKAGRVSSGEITKPVAPGLIVSSNVIPLLVTNPRVSVGGDDAETLAQAKQNAGKKFKAREAAVTKQDYEAHAGTYSDPLYGRVAAAHPLVSRSAASDIVFADQINLILAAVSTPEATVTAGTDSLTTHLENITNFLSDITDELTDIGASVTSANSDLTTAVDSTRAARNAVQNVLSGVSTAQTAINAIATDVADKLTIATRDILLGYLTLIQTAGSTAQASEDAALTALGSVQDSLTGIGETTSDPETNLLAIATFIADIEGEIGDPGTPSQAYSDIASIAAALATVVSDVSAAVVILQSHQDKILADDCQANLVTVPILQLDAGGFYVAPSLGLISSLQARLDAIKEATQVVEVTSGESLLLPVVLTIRLGVKSTFKESVVAATASSATDALLRGRAFDDDLDLSDVYDALLPVAGIAFRNVKIEGHLDSDDNLVTTNLDADGNFIVPNQEVVTKGTVTITTEIVQVTE